MAASFEKALPMLLLHEGGFVDNKQDAGGPTSSGVSLRFLKNENLVNGDFDGDGQVTVKDLKIMTPAQTALIYRTCFWDACNLGLIISQRIATAMLNIVVNVGARQGIKLLQQSINYLFPKLLLSVDGKLGPLTLRAVNLRSPLALMATLKDFLSHFYINLVKSTPKMSNSCVAGLDVARIIDTP